MRAAGAGWNEEGPSASKIQMIRDRQQLRLAEDALGDLYEALIALKASVGSDTSTFAVLAEGPIKEIRRIQAEVDEFSDITQDKKEKSMSDPVSLTVPQSVIKEVVEERIRTAVVEAMEGSDGLVNKIVSMALNSRCAADGKISNYSSENKYTFLEATCLRVIRKATEKAVHEWAKKNEKLIQAALEKEMKGSAKGIAKTVVATIQEAAKSQYRVTVNVEGEKY